MKAAEKVGFVLLIIGLIFVMLVAWLAFSIFIGMNAMPQLILQVGSDPNLALANAFAVFFILAIITW